MKPMVILAAGVFAALSMAGSATAGTNYIAIPTRVGNGADAVVGWVEPDRAYGAETYLNLRAWTDDDNNHNYKTYLRFDLSAAGIAHPTRITAAKLECTLVGVTLDADEKSIRIYSLHEDDDNWTEDSITWNNAPGNTNHIYNMVPGTGPGQCRWVGDFQVSAAPLRPPDPPYTPSGHSYTFSAENVTNFFKGDADGIVSFALTARSENSNWHVFAPKEYSADADTPPPTLTLEVDAPSHKNVTMTPTNDATIMEANKDAVSSVAMAKYWVGDHYKSYLRFDLPAAGVTDWSRVSSARFGIRLKNYIGDGKPKQIRVYGLHEAHDDWTEASLTWNNAPANVNEAGNAIDSGKGVLLATFTVPDSPPQWDRPDVPGDPPKEVGDYYYAAFDCDRLPDFLAQETDGSITLVLAAGTYSGEYHAFHHMGWGAGYMPELTVSLRPPRGTLILIR